MYLNPNKKTVLKDFGTIPYSRAWDIQLLHHQYLTALKIHSRNENISLTVPNYLLLCEHNPVYTLGKNGNYSNLLISSQELLDRNIEFFHIERGGDITFHGPGQITGYPILDLENFFTDLHKYLRKIENAIILTVAHFGISSGIFPGLTGVWVEPEGDFPRKIAAIGIKCSRWVTLHGFALNVNTDLNYFNSIIPCAISDENKSVTSIQKETGKVINMAEVKQVLVKNLAEVFGWDYV